MSHQQELIPVAGGEFLKQHRIKRNLTLAQVASAINLDEALLACIEEERADHIAEVYRKGYISSYAKFLNIPEGEINSMLDSAQSKQPVLKTIFTEAPKRKPIDNWLRATSYVLASLLIGTLAWQFTHEAVRLSQSSTNLPAAQDGPVNASIASLDVLQGSQKKSPDVASQAWAALNNSTPPEGQSRMLVSVSADSWVEISDADGVELEMDLLRAGSDKIYQGKPPFQVLFGRASAVSLVMDGKRIDLKPFTNDDVVQMRWPPQQD